MDVLIGGLLAAHGAQKLFGWHRAGFWSGIAVLAGPPDPQGGTSGSTSGSSGMAK